MGRDYLPTIHNAPNDHFYWDLFHEGLTDLEAVSLRKRVVHMAPSGGASGGSQSSPQKLSFQSDCSRGPFRLSAAARGWLASSIPQVANLEAMR